MWKEAKGIFRFPRAWDGIERGLPTTLSSKAFGPWQDVPEGLEGSKAGNTARVRANFVRKQLRLAGGNGE